MSKGFSYEPGNRAGSVTGINCVVCFFCCCCFLFCLFCFVLFLQLFCFCFFYGKGTKSKWWTINLYHWLSNASNFTYKLVRMLLKWKHIILASFMRKRRYSVKNVSSQSARLVCSYGKNFIMPVRVSTVKRNIP